MKLINNHITLVLLLLIGCTSKQTATESKEVETDSVTTKIVTDSFAGKYEYDGGAQASGIGYLYQSLTLEQKGDSISGTLFSALYLSKSEGGGYTSPEITIETPLAGRTTNASEAILDPGVSDIAKVEDGNYLYPYFLKAFMPDAQDDLHMIIEKVDNTIKISTSNANEPKLLFEKVKN